MKSKFCAALAAFSLSFPTSGTATANGSEDQVSGMKFRDVRAASGIEWKHEFIDQETGNTYKLNPYDHGSGVLVADVNGDAHDDLLFIDFLGENALYLGQGQGKFEDHTGPSGLGLPRTITVGGCFGDYDNDGDQDLYLTTYRQGNHLFRNRGDGTFEDVTEKAGVGHQGHSNSATFFDYDRDGDLDLYLTNIGKFTTDTIDEHMGYYVGVALPFDALSADTTTPWDGEKNVLWRNDGDGKFTDVTDEAGVGAGSWNGDASVWDYDRDGDLDLYVANMFGSNNLYRNDGSGKFTDVADTALGLTSWGAIGSRFFDADNDGLPEIIVVDMHSDMWTDPFDPDGLAELDGTAKYRTPAGPLAPGRVGRRIENLDKLRQSGKVLFGNSFFHNKGDGTFDEISIPAGVETFWPWGIAVADFDRDLHQDVFLPSGMSYPYGYWPNRLLHNQGDLSFKEVGTDAGIDPPTGGPYQDLVIKGVPFARSSRTAAVLDFDADGDLDLIVNNFNDHPYIYANEAPARNWVGIRLAGNGTSTNRDAFGSVVTVEAGGVKQVRCAESATGYLSQSTAMLHFGLGEHEKLERVTVQWLGGEEQDVTEQVKLNQVTRITQG